MKRLRQPSPLKSICHELSTYPDSFEPRTLSHRFVEIRQAETVQMTWISKTSHSRSLLCDLACGVLIFTPSRRIGISSVPSKPHSERVSSHIIQWRVMLLCFFFSRRVGGESCEAKPPETVWLSNLPSHPQSIKILDSHCQSREASSSASKWVLCQRFELGVGR
jgi:hypothetical protein